MKRRLFGAVAAVVLATTGTLVLVAYVNGARDRAVQGGALVEVLIVKDAIPRGTAASALADKVRVVKVPSSVRVKGGVTDLGALGAKVASVALLPGETLTSARFVAPELATAAGIAPELLRMTLSLEPARALGGQLRTGDRVGVMASFPADGLDPAVTHLILNKVVIAAVQSEDVAVTNATPKTGSEENATAAPTGKLLVTLALDAPSAEKLAFAAEHGTVWLAAQTDDSNVSGTSINTRQGVLR